MQLLRPLLVIFLIFYLSCAKSQKCKGYEITKGPYVQRVTSTSATVYWEIMESPEHGCVYVEYMKEGTENITKEAGSFQPFEVNLAWDLSPEPDLAGTYYMNSVTISGLEPGTKYIYRIPTPEGGIEGRFRTSVPPGTPFRFIAIGDTATNTEELKKNVQNIVKESPDFILHTGDLQYYSMLLDSWSTFFKNFAPALLISPFYPSVGNHEYEIPLENGTEEYNQYYSRFFPAPSQSGVTDYYSFDYGNGHFISLNTEIDYYPGTEQYNWLDEDLKKAEQNPDTVFTAVFFHKPPYTLSDHSPDNKAREYLVPLFQSHGVKLVLNGHNHVYERFEVGAITYIVTGGGGAFLYKLRQQDLPDDEKYLKKDAKEYHIVVFDADKDKIHGRAININGAILDEFDVIW